MASPGSPGDLVQLWHPGPDEPRGHGLIVAIDTAGWSHIQWYNEALDELWYPPARIRVISAACEKD